MAASSLSARRAVTGVFALIAVAACSPDAPNVLAPPAAANLAAVGNQDDLGPALAAQRRHTGDSWRIATFSAPPLGDS